MPILADMREAFCYQVFNSHCNGTGTRKFGMKKKILPILLRPEHTRVEIVNILTALPVRPDALGRIEQVYGVFSNGRLELGESRLLISRKQGP